jgi:hypothetical protein
VHVFVLCIERAGKKMAAAKEKYRSSYLRVGQNISVVFSAKAADTVLEGLD